ncbi:MAG TPA: HAD family phosphatase [Candidatus Marinimicrobia bacterium]|nr:HAD family phosphatase [Candidatus Neomarinimicrobiota bacterium]HRS52360.1 HAD family phosphatase [Candidatus Neomarinimicrobiota bacterium]HRU92991.1 HAD family phosphatase [Candidatus Neomarinimicrobiota bacterium]
MAIRAIIFDFDGVVVDTEPLYLAAQRRLFKQYGIKVPDEDWKYFRGTTEHDFYQLVMTRYQVKTDVQELIEDGRRLIKEEFSKGIDYFPGFRDFWQSINGRYRTGLVTSTSASFLEWIFRNTPVRNNFDLTITADDVRQAKPHPEPYLKAFAGLRVRPEESVIIEDSLNGIQAAITSGAVTIGFRCDRQDCDLPNIHFHADNYAEVTGILARIG